MSGNQVDQNTVIAQCHREHAESGYGFEDENAIYLGDANPEFQSLVHKGMAWEKLRQWAINQWNTHEDTDDGRLFLDIMDKLEKAG